MTQKKASIQTPTEAKWFPDAYGVFCCKCPNCQFFMAPVRIGEKYICPDCKWEFKVIT